MMGGGTLTEDHIEPQDPKRRERGRRGRKKGKSTRGRPHTKHTANKRTSMGGLQPVLVNKLWMAQKDNHGFDSKVQQWEDIKKAKRSEWLRIAKSPLARDRSNPAYETIYVPGIGMVDPIWDSRKNKKCWVCPLDYGDRSGRTVLSMREATTPFACRRQPGYILRSKPLRGDDKKVVCPQSRTSNGCKVAKTAMATTGIVTDAVNAHEMMHRVLGDSQHPYAELVC